MAMRAAFALCGTVIGTSTMYDVLAEGDLGILLLIVGPALAILGIVLAIIAWLSQRYEDSQHADRKALSATDCPICGYDLTGNVSGVCPECGTRM